MLLVIALHRGGTCVVRSLAQERCVLFLFVAWEAAPSSQESVLPSYGMILRGTILVRVTSKGRIRSSGRTALQFHSDHRLPSRIELGIASIGWASVVHAVTVSNSHTA